MGRAALTLYLASGIVSLVAVACRTVWLSATSGRAQLLQVDLLRLVYDVAVKAELLPLLGLFPHVVHRTFDLAEPGAALRFLALASVTGLLAYGILATGLLLALFAVERLRRRHRDRSGSGGGMAHPAGLLGFFALPGVLLFVRDARPALGTSATVATAVATCGALALVLWLIAPQAARLERALRAAGRGAAVALVLILIAGLGSLGTAHQTSLPPSVSAPPGAPNLLLVSIDSLRHDHLGCYGYARDTSPHIDQLAAEGVRFTNALSPTSWTLPAHMTLLTGLPPERHGVNVDGRRLQKEVLTFAEVLREAGWATAGFVSGPYLHSSYGFAQGFGRYDDATFVSPDVLSHRAVTSPGLVQLVIGWLQEWRRAEASAPFFVFLHMWDVHYDFIPPAPFDEMFDPDYEGEVTADLFSRSRDIHPEMERRDLDHVIALYDGEIRYTDFHLGKLLDHLAERGLLDATIVLVTADHGEEFFEHGEKGHGQNLYGETVRVPLVARWPVKISPGRVVDQLVTLEDVPRTLLSLLGIPAAPELARWGRDLSPLLDGPAGSVPRRAAFGDLRGQLAYLRTDSHKFISTLVGPRREELYDLRSDPAERRNLLEARPGLGGEFRAELWRWRGGSAHADGFAEPAPPPPELELQLRALGYIE